MSEKHWLARMSEKQWVVGRPTLKRESLETVTSDTQTQITAFWEALRGLGFSPRFIDRVWAANRCMQLVSQQIATMPLRFFGRSEPAWVSSPDPLWYPNGIGDAVFAATWSMYGWGDAFLYITDRYANGLPSAWTVLDPEPVSVRVVNGRKLYRSGQQPLNPDNVVQITRDPHGNGLRGTSALRAYAPHLWAAESSAELGRIMMGEGGVPNAVLKSTRKLTESQAIAIQDQWINRTAQRAGAPAVLPPEIDFEQLAFSPKDLLLLEAQGFSARVIASAFGVPPFMLNLPLEGGLTYQSPEMLFETWWRTELRPAAFRISRALSANMLPRGSWVEFDARDVLAPTFREQVDAWSKMLADQVVTIDEFRAAVLRLAPLAEGEAIEELTVPSVAASSGTSTSTNVQALHPSAAQEVAQ